jgi:hypothetical protein
MRHIIPISGKDSLATAFVQTAREPSRDFEYVFNDCRTELPETYRWLDSIEEKTGWTIQRVGSNLDRTIRDEGILPSPRVRFCTRKAKIKPMQKWLGSDEVTLYYGLRADENRTGYVPVNGQEVEYPLQELGIDLDGVYRILEAKNLRPPSFWWEGMYQRVRSKIRDGWQDEFRQWEMEQLFAWRTRANCHFCFFQREYEWVGLYEHHPDLFWDAVGMEWDVGGDEYTWRKKPMTIVLDADWRQKVKERRANKIGKRIKQAVQLNVFAEQDNAISQTSCGLLCGK